MTSVKMVKEWTSSAGTICVYIIHSKNIFPDLAENFSKLCSHAGGVLREAT